MDKVIKEKWIAALRSGEYTQAQNRLRIKNGDNSFSYCCLGVLCNIIDPDGWKDADCWLYDGKEQAGIPSALCGPYDISLRSQWDLAEMNDNGKNFTEIADYIEKNL